MLLQELATKMVKRLEQMPLSERIGGLRVENREP